MMEWTSYVTVPAVSLRSGNWENALRTLPTRLARQTSLWLTSDNNRRPHPPLLPHSIRPSANGPSPPGDKPTTFSPKGHVLIISRDEQITLILPKMNSDDCLLAEHFTAKCANSVQQNSQQMLANANAIPRPPSLCHPTPTYLSNFTAQLSHCPPMTDPSLSAKIFQMNAIQNPLSKRIAVQQPPVISKIAAGEEPSDSGNETSSLSPGHTPMTVSPIHSLPSRSNSFSVSNILRVQQQMGRDQMTHSAENAMELRDQSVEKEAIVNYQCHSELTGEQKTAKAQPKSAQMVFCNGPIKAQTDITQQRVPFQLHPSVPFPNHSANASPMLSHPHSGFRAPTIPAFPAYNHHPLYPSTGHPLGPLFSYQHPPGVVLASATSHASPSSSSAIAPFVFAPSPAHGINPLLLSNSALSLPMLFTLIKQQQQQQNECCVVCGDRASGHHYGVQSCEGCKGFFRRSIQQQGEKARFECTKNEQCVVDKVSRNRCQKCRLEKCFRVGMQPTHVRLEKNRKRKSDSEQRDSGFEVTRQAVELINAVVLAFKSSFLTSVTDNIGKSAQLINFPNLSSARDRCQLFVEAVPDFSDFDKNILLSNNCVSAVMTVLIVLLNTHDNHQHKLLQLREQQLSRVRQCFSDFELHWEEVAVFVSVMITFDGRSERTEQLFVRLCQGLLVKLSDRVAEDGENVNPGDINNTKTLDLYTKLITIISQIFQHSE